VSSAGRHISVCLRYRTTQLDVLG